MKMMLRIMLSMLSIETFASISGSSVQFDNSRHVVIIQFMRIPYSFSSSNSSMSYSLLTSIND